MSEDHPTTDIDHVIGSTLSDYLDTIEPLLPPNSFAVFAIMTPELVRFYHTEGLKRTDVADILRLLADQIERAESARPDDDE